jgi:pSer/pThr/pTyr-binding forkhead associated (FHA) protein
MRSLPSRASSDFTLAKGYQVERTSRPGRMTEPQGRPEPSASHHISDSTQSAHTRNERGLVREHQAEEPRLVLALMCHRPLAEGMSIPLTEVDELRIGRGQMRLVYPNGRRMVVLLDDGEMSRQHAIFRRTTTGWMVEDLASKNGTSVNGDAVQRTPLDDGDVIELGSCLLIFRSQRGDADVDIPRAHRVNTDVAPSEPPFFRTLLADLDQRLRDLAEISASQVPVLVQGETGTGKELIARAVHRLSGRRGEFVAINCGALPQSLIEGELFGYVRGAFTGATADRPGLVRTADHGTLFLDEIGDLPPTAQIALLRVLQEQVVTPLGANHPVEVDIRVVAATHRPLAEMMGRGEFRRDLHARLAGFELTVPPLRERREDIGILVAVILRRLGNKACDVTFHRAAARALIGYPYPANIRELEQALRSAVILAHGGQIRLEHLPQSVQRFRWSSVAGSLEDHSTREILLKTLQQTKGNVTETGRIMNKAPMQIRRWIRRFNIDLPSFRPRA